MQTSSVKVASSGMAQAETSNSIINTRPRGSTGFINYQERATLVQYSSTKQIRGGESNQTRGLVNLNELLG